MPHTLLLADDSVTIQRLVSLTFASEEIDVLVAGDGNQAVSIMAHTAPDIVLADVGMPGRDGYELTRHIRQTPALATVPVILLTGAFEPVDQARANEVGCDAVLVKPFEPQAVVSRVKELLARRQTPAATGPRPPEAARLDDYFSQLDQAIAAKAVAPAPAPAIPVAPATQVPSAAQSDAVAAADEPVLAGAFSALLAAEQSGAEPDAFAEWLPEASAAPVGTATITEETIDRIVERVLARLSEQVVNDAVRSAVASLTSATAERLVLEEIERIKSHIK